MRHVAVDDLLREPLDDGGLADTRLADEDGVVLGAAAQHLLDALELVVAAHERVELVLHGRFGQVAAEFSQERRFLDARQRGLLVEQLHDVVAHRVQPHALLHEDGGGDGSLFAQDSEQEVLGADVVVQQAVGLFGGRLEDALGFGAERDSDRRRDFFAENRTAFDFLADVFERQVRAREDPARQTFTFPDESEQQVLGFNRHTPELTGLVPGKEENSSCPLGVPLKHPGNLR